MEGGGGRSSLFSASTAPGHVRMEEAVQARLCVLTDASR